MNKRKRSNITFTVIMCVIMAILLIGEVAAQILMNQYSGAMDSFFGAGTATIETIEGAEALDGQYYDFSCTTVEEAQAYSAEVNDLVVGEGAVMLKNEDNALPLAKDAKITLLGVNTLHYVTGPADDPYTSSNTHTTTLKEGFEAQGFSVNQAVWDYYVRYQSTSPSKDELGEIDPKNYPAEVTDSYAEYGDAAIVLLRRATGEGTDPAKDMGAGENNRTKLSPSEKELNLLAHACENFDTVIVIVNSPNTMELGFLVDGANYTDKYTGKTYDFSNIKAGFWVGGFGLSGAEAFAKLLNGTMNPSGHLVDTYVRDLKADPTYQNVGLYEYTNTTTLEGVGVANQYGTNGGEEYYCLTGQAFTVEYEEGIYVGYRYYETAAYEASKGNYEGFDYDNAVLYPFGYGLSYTTFTSAYEGTPVYDKETDEFIFNVKVTNTGSVAGKHVAQIYVNAPYDYSNHVEKAHVVLVGFAKTSELAPGASETLEIRVKRDYIASYDYKVAKCYILDAGNYNFYLSDNAHSWASISNDDATKCYTWTLDSKIEFKADGAGSEEKRTTDQVAAENLFDEEVNWKFKEYTENQPGSGYATNFTRANFKASFPTSPIANDLVAQQATIDGLSTYKPDEGDPYPVDYGITETPVTGAYAGLQLIQMRGVDYDDPLWDTFIQQLTLDELTVSFGGGGWTEYPVESLGIPYAYGADGPAGFYSFVLSGTDTYYPHFAEVTLTATWSVELAALYGDALAEEAQVQRTCTSAGASLTYMFGPGANTHRSAFGGRNYEYYSEDGLLGGKICAAECGALASKGVVTLVKHLALNEQETARQGANGSGSNTTYNSWVNEQAIRELYMRVWEIYAKEAKATYKYYAKMEDGSYELVEKEMTGATAVMTSYNRIGTVWTGASELISGIMRAECGFTGTSYTDAGGTIDGYMNTDAGLHTLGTDVCLLPNQSPEATLAECLRDTDSDVTIYCLQDAAHRRLYNLVNSNAMIGISPTSVVVYGTAPWQEALQISLYVVIALEVLGAVAIVLKWKMNPVKKKEKE